MTIEIVTVPCRSDNYAFLVHDGDTGCTALVDAPEAAPILSALEARGWTLGQLFLTHHHDDHIAGTEELRTRYGCSVYGGAADAHRLPPLDHALSEGDSVDCAGHPMQVLDVSGHTVGHLAFYLPAAKAAFTADSLMALGCGRVFEGTMPQMWHSLSKLAALPPDTTICSGHEYTATNAAFAATIEPDNQDLQTRISAVKAARAKGAFTVPSLLSEELATNPFLRAGLSSVKSALTMPSAPDAEVFAEIRRRKDSF
ncbi:MAG: hydroxyacylglutathione hydrolase [Rhodobacteraceae bacterium]|nr:hydroxyacylglutathione hydrolase [Paracoccaceae bacterium]